MTRQPYTPRPYQHDTENHVLDVKRCGVFARMGMGKTVSVYTSLDDLFISGYETKPALVLAPKRVALSTWPDEALKWEHLHAVEAAGFSATGEDRARLRAELHRGNVSVYATTYDNIPWLVEQLGDNWPWGAHIADESTRLKSFRLKNGGRRAQALGKIAHKHATRWVNLSGTPSPNGLQDLWGQLWFLDAGQRLGRTMEAFKQRWFKPKWDGYGIEVLPHAETEIHAKIADICISLNPKDYFPLKDPIETTINVELPQRARQLYAQMEREMFMRIEEHDVTAVNAGVKTMKCLQLANGAAYVGEDSKEWREVHDVKIQALESIIEEAAGAPILVAYHFKSDLARILKAFPKARELDASPATIRQWNKGEIQLLAAHPSSCGHGLNLQDGGNILAFFGHNWNLEEYEQIIERIGPMRQLQAGHDRNVFIYHIVATDTVEETCIKRIKTKRSTQDLLLEALNNYKKRRH